MRKQDFIAARIERWNRLTRLLDLLEHSNAGKLEDHELDEFVYLYRIACSDLARARSEGLGDDVEGFLNETVARGYKQFHPPKAPSLHGLLYFFAAGFPKAVRAEGWYILVATLLFVLSTAVTSAVVLDDPARAYLLSPPDQLEMLLNAYAKGHQGGRSEGEDSAMMGYYIHNNIGIAFRCFATGIFFGLGSIFFLVINGILGGAVGAFICAAGYSENFLSFVIGHGAFELTAIVLSGATGLHLGMLLVNPGRFNRLDAMKVRGPSMIKVILGVAMMLFIAALIEGFWSPSGAPTQVKFFVGGALWVLVISYLVFAGQGLSRVPLSESTKVFR